ncbi:AimR family lysis-lysogeny pheromone receptor [Amphibacillus sp. Q70]|uniref:AimR family lysis-lysogeny pheromone receptor n=1 Tax=Amphibacillus sp. Q70 TaxID=3453416 RepID=UPI003F85F772
MSRRNFPAHKTDICFMNVEQYLIWLESYVDIEEHPKRLKEFFLKTNDPYSLCVGLEYLLMYGYYTELDKLVERNKHHKNNQNREWAYLYELVIAKQKRTYKRRELLEKAQRFKTDDIPLQCIQLFFMISLYFDLFEHEMLANKLDILLEKIKKVNYPVLAPLLNRRLNLVLFNHYWIRNEMILARKHGFEALDGTDNSYHLANLHINLSLSYIFESFESAKYHLNEALLIAKEKNIPRMIEIINQHNMPFIYAHFNRPDGITTPIKSEQAHLAIAKGELITAQRLLSEVTEDTPFTKYYLGRAYQDRRLLLQSYNEFLEYRRDHFFARLPLTALKKL